MEKLRIGIIGFGNRGKVLSKPILENMPDIDVIGICDKYADRVDFGCKLVEDARGVRPFGTTDYHEILKMENIDAVICSTDWEMHTQICLDCMNAGIPVGVEVGGAYSLDQCWELVHTYERTGTPCMMLENACYGDVELALLKMIKEGMFGELVHEEGGYRHDLRKQIADGHVDRHYRQRNYLNRNNHHYPSHELLPIMKNLNINRGNRMLTLVSMASKAAGMNSFGKRFRGEDSISASAKFAQGDVVHTLIKCAHGEVISLTNDTTLPRPYSRCRVVQGTLGVYTEEKYGVLFDTPDADKRKESEHVYTSMDEMLKEHRHPLWKGYEAVGGHGGVDYLVLRAFFESVMNGTKPPIDIYDTVTVMAITPLTEMSIASGSMPVAIPDFTNGSWTNREPYDRTRYCLEEVCEDLF